MRGGEIVCQSISRSISLLRERGVCAVLRQQQCAHTNPKTRENRPTPKDEVQNRENGSVKSRLFTSITCKRVGEQGGYITYRGRDAVEQR